MKNKRFLIVLAAFVFAAAVFAVAWSRRPAAEPVPGARKLKIVTTLFPLYDMAGAIGAGKAEVSLLLLPGVEPHSYEPKPGDIVRINEADIFIYTGGSMEPWAEDLIKSVSNKGLTVLNAGLGVTLMRGTGTGPAEPENAPDPHIWLDLDNAGVMAGNILAALENKDPSNKDLYQRAAAAYRGRLAALDTAYKTGLSACRTKEIIYGGHYAFGYLARRYGLKYLAAQGLSPDSEPTARDLVALVEQVKKDKIKFVFYEELTSPRIAEAITGETGAKMLLLNAAHNVSRDQMERGVSFFDILQSDLDNLREGLECR
ncbi:MAG: hypothetical protein A2270_00905 [Elusimicrobia bacterium RIFOXYA12_FULL_51_18]|nr:MAG: hypothetical protein A2270_00905 [Elusimicrobia bacterium RIFOXYA12_FULL_51_18]OGS29053.1 MAG: hypothetical protein A2218_08920 [Elusimicrobia bacterium RIFOXYA2_FULL_53_38]